MNRLHRYFCRSPKYQRRLEHGLLPWVIGSSDLGDELLEIGPGPGLTTELLRARTTHLTAVEIDSALASAVASKFPDVEVVNADATELPLPFLLEMKRKMSWTGLLMMSTSSLVWVVAMSQKFSFPEIMILFLCLMRLENMIILPIIINTKIITIITWPYTFLTTNIT